MPAVELARRCLPGVALERETASPVSLREACEVVGDNTGRIFF
jgi:hypothetical protein